VLLRAGRDATLGEHATLYSIQWPAPSAAPESCASLLTSATRAVARASAAQLGLESRGEEGGEEEVEEEGREEQGGGAGEDTAMDLPLGLSGMKQALSSSSRCVYAARGMHGVGGLSQCTGAGAEPQPQERAHACMYVEQARDDEAGTALMPRAGA